MRSFFSFSFQSASGKPCILSRKTKTPLEAGLKSFGGERGSIYMIPRWERRFNGFFADWRRRFRLRENFFSGKPEEYFP
jgi:hypothetical protein